MSDLAEYRERVAEVLIQHQRIPLFDDTFGQRCVGCDSLYGETDGPNSPRHAAHLAAALLEPGGVVAEVYQRGYDDGCDDPESMWTSTKQAYRDQGAAEVRARVEAVLSEVDEWTPYDSRDTGETFLADSVRDLVADLRAALDTRVIPPGGDDA